ncbi:hypothetical protein [Schumannella luteola]
MDTLTQDAGRVLDGLGLHMLLLGAGRFAVTRVEPPRIEGVLELHPGQRPSEAVAAVSLAIDDQQLDALSFDRRDRWGEVQHLVRVRYVIEGTRWDVDFTLRPSGLQEH